MNMDLELQKSIFGQILQTKPWVKSNMFLIWMVAV